MKALILACGLAAAAGAANAATYKFSFVSEVLQPTEYCFEVEDDYGECTSYESVRAEIVVKLPDLVSRTVTLSMDIIGDDYDFYGIIVANYPLLRVYDTSSYGPGTDPFDLFGYDFYAGLQTDTTGRLSYAYYSWGDEGWDVDIDWDSVRVGPLGEMLYEGRGHWKVSPVPLPAGGLLLFASLAALVLKRRRRA